jgi:hypothetical protein
MVYPGNLVLVENPDPMLAQQGCRHARTVYRGVREMPIIDCAAATGWAVLSQNRYGYAMLLAQRKSKLRSRDKFCREILATASYDTGFTQ